jgi:hypothetical protein
MLSTSGGLAPGFYAGVPLKQYLTLNALGSTELEWLNVSPLHYRYMRARTAAPDSEALARGTALHTAVLEPDLFAERYASEPDIDAIGGAKPRATNAYKEAVAELEASGRSVLKNGIAAEIRAMAVSVLSHPHAYKVLTKSPERETTAFWERDGRLCRGRFDALGDGLLADLKTTRSLRSFSPFAITNLGYYRQAGWYVDGLRRLGRDIKHMFFVAVESVPPYDVGVFVLDAAALAAGQIECDRLLAKLASCELTGEWPGMFPDVQQAILSDAVVAQLAEE